MCFMAARTSAFFICVLLSLYAGAGAGHQPFHLGERRHGAVAGCGHGERPVGDSGVERPLHAAPSEQTVNQAGSERVSAANPVEDLHV